MEIRE